MAAAASSASSFLFTPPPRQGPSSKLLQRRSLLLQPPREAAGPPPSSLAALNNTAAAAVFDVTKPLYTYHTNISRGNQGQSVSQINLVSKSRHQFIISCQNGPALAIENHCLGFLSRP